MFGCALPIRRGVTPPISAVRGLVRQHRELDVEEPEVDPLTRAGTLAQPQRRQHGDRAVEAGEEVGIGHPGLLRRPVRLAGQVHDPAHRLDDEVVARPRGQRPVLAEAGHRGIDHPGVRRRDRRIVEPEPDQPADLEVLHHHVRAGGERPGAGEVVRVGEVERDAALAAVAGVEVGRRAVGGERRPPAAGLVAAGRLDLDHVGAEVGEGLADPRPGEHPRELQHPQPGQRSFRHLASLPAGIGQARRPRSRGGGAASNALSRPRRRSLASTGRSRPCIRVVHGSCMGCACLVHEA